MESTNGIIRIHVLKANLDGVGGLFHSMHVQVHITVHEHGAGVWKSGLAEDSGHKCHWKDKHCDIESSKAGLTMNIAAMDYEKQHGQLLAHLIGEVELGVGTFLVPAEKEIEVFHKDKHDRVCKAGHITFRSEFIPIPAK